MNRHRLAGVSLAAVGVALFAVLLVSGTIRHPVAAAESTTHVEYGAIGTSFALVTAGVLLVMATSIPD